MANSAEIGAGEVRAKKSQYNNLRKDVLDPTTGHDHSGAADHGIQIPNSGIATATVAPTADTIMLRDASGNSQVAAPVDEADIARYDTFMDIMQSDTVYVAGNFYLTGSYVDVPSLTLSITLLKTSLVIVMCAWNFTTIIEPTNLIANVTMKAFVGATESTETRSSRGINNYSEESNTMFAFSGVTVGTYTVKMQQLRSDPGGTSVLTAYTSKNRMTVIVIPQA